MFGNTIGWECADNAGVPAPVLGTIDCPNGQGAAIRDTAPDVFWRSESPLDGQATAILTFDATQARSTAVLAIPTGATITYARIYWGAMLGTPMSTDANVRVEYPKNAINQLDPRRRPVLRRSRYQQLVPVDGRDHRHRHGEQGRRVPHQRDVGSVKPEWA